MRFKLPYESVYDNSGDSLSGAKLYFYESGTTTPLDTYSDAALTIPNTNPVIANSSGRFGDIFLNQTNYYKSILTDADGVTIWTADPTQTLGSDISVLSTGTTTPRTLTERFSDSFNVKDFGAKADGITDDASAFQACIDAAAVYAASSGGKGYVYVPPQVYNIGSTLNLKPEVTIWGYGAVLETDEVNYCFYASNASADGVSIYGIRLVEQTPLSATPTAGIRLVNCDDTLIQDCFVEGYTQYGILCGGDPAATGTAANVRYVNNYIKNIGQSGITTAVGLYFYPYTQSVGFLAIGNTVDISLVSNFEGTAAKFEFAFRPVITGNNFKRAGGGALGGSAAVELDTLSFGTFSNNNISNSDASGYGGLSIQDCEDSIVSTNALSGTEPHLTMSKDNVRLQVLNNNLTNVGDILDIGTGASATTYADCTIAGNIALNIILVSQTIDGLFIKGNFVDYVIQLKPAAVTTSENIVISNNEILGSGTGVCEFHGDNITFIKNSYYNNSGSSKTNMMVLKGADSIIVENAIFTVSGATNLIFMNGSSNARIDSNIVYGAFTVFALQGAAETYTTRGNRGVTQLEGAVTWNPGAPLADGAGVTSANITVTGCSVGDAVEVVPGENPQGALYQGFVSAADTINIRVQNETGGNLTFASTSWKVRVIK